MEHLSLEILPEEAQRGNKHSNTFKTVFINRVAEAIIERFQVQCDAKHVENHLRTVKNQWQIICTIRGESGFGWDDNMKMITCDRATYDAAMMAHKKYEPFLNKSIDHYDEMALVVGKDMATGSFARTFANIDLDDGNQDSVPIDCDNEETEETPHLYEEVMSMEEEGFDDDFLCSVFDYLVSHESEAKTFLVKNMAPGSFSKTFADIDLDDGNKDSVPIDCDNKETEETPHLYKEVMSMEEEGFDDDFLCSVFDYLVSHESEAKAFLVKTEPVQLTGQPLQWSSKRIDCSKPKTVHFAPNSFPTALKLPPPQPAPPANPVSVQAAGNRLSSLSTLVGFPRTLLLLNALCRCTVDARSSGGLLRWSRRPISGQLLTPSIFFFGSLILFVVDGNGLSRVDGEDLAVLRLSGKPDLRMCGV
ncbi:hypothetical protein GOBAR_AA40382 [Gossypium barbadense]|uniref:Myb/SANT-like domain-containing protein n=1 Tax=Gossypium barbadense TaxID=3634 RepID=A0A2P5VNC5_GOSBA|nr:hypothetical protein GOBAR_AA40382 [Gossypium barbadense]